MLYSFGCIDIGFVLLVPSANACLAIILTLLSYRVQAVAGNAVNGGSKKLS